MIDIVDLPVGLEDSTLSDKNSFLRALFRRLPLGGQRLARQNVLGFDRRQRAGASGRALAEPAGRWWG
jgi:hypothetical protein